MSDMLTSRSIRWPLGPNRISESPLTDGREGGPVGDDAPADDARLDSLRGELIRELDRFAAGGYGTTASFRRI